MITVNLVLYGLILPVVIYGTAVCIIWQPWKRNSTGYQAQWSGPPGLGLGYMAGYIGLQGVPRIPPGESLQWLLVLVFVITAVCTVEKLLRAGNAWHWSMRIVFACILPFLLLQSMFRYNWGTGEGIVYLALTGLVILAFISVLGRVVGPQRGFYAPLLMSIFAGGSSIVFLISGSALLGNLTGILGAMLGVGFLVSLRNSSFEPGRETITIYSTIYLGLLLNSYFYADLPAVSAVLLILAPAAVLAVSMIPALHHKPVLEKTTGIVIIAIMVGAALFFAIQSSPPLDYGYLLNNLIVS